MRPLLAVSLFAMFLFPVAVLAQTQGKLSSSSKCATSQVHQTIVVDDGRQHSISLDQRQCTWNAPVSIAGLSGAVYTSYGVDDVQGNRAHDRGYAVGVMENGDKYFLRYDGGSIMNGNVPVRLNGTWTFTGGTGRLQHLRGKGTYRAKPTATGEMEFLIEGTYTISTQ